MFIPLFIAIFLGLVNPANVSNTSNCHGGGTVVVNAEGDPGDTGDPGETGDPGDDTGDDGPGTGGGTGNIPPPKP